MARRIGEGQADLGHELDDQTDPGLSAPPANGFRGHPQVHESFPESHLQRKRNVDILESSLIYINCLQWRTPMRSSAVLKQVPGAQNISPQLLTAQELARVLKLNPQTLYRLARRGVLPAIRIGKKSLRFDPAQVRMAFQAQPTPLAVVAPPPSPTGRAAFTMLDDLLAQGRWLTAPRTLSLKRFAVRFPPGADLTALAYERGRP